MPSDHHTLYNFRRCPYAMRARMALHKAEIDAKVHEVDLKNKPEALYKLSPAGTVPVMLLSDGTVLHHSTEIVKWALEQNDPDDWLNIDKDDADTLISYTDGPFKGALDRYKYPTRFPDEDCSNARDQVQAFLEQLNTRLELTKHLCETPISYCDTSIFPFIRQCAHVDRDWFRSLPLPKLHDWFDVQIESDLFKSTMKKQKEETYTLKDLRLDS